MPVRRVRLPASCASCYFFLNVEPVSTVMVSATALLRAGPKRMCILLTWSSVVMVLFPALHGEPACAPAIHSSSGVRRS